MAKRTYTALITIDDEGVILPQATRLAGEIQGHLEVNVGYASAQVDVFEGDRTEGKAWPFPSREIDLPGAKHLHARLRKD